MTDNSNTRRFPPELKVDFDRTEPAGLRKVKEVPKQVKQGNNWVDNPNGSTKEVAQALNHVHVVLRYQDAYKDPQTKKFPVYNFGGGPTVSINWRMYIVGPIAREADGTTLTRTTLPVEVAWSDRSTDAWVYDMMTRVINETLQANPGTNIRDHVFEFGKKQGTTPAGAWYFKYAGRLSALYPNIQLPQEQAQGQGGQGGARRERPSGPSSAVLNSMPEGARLPSRRENQAATTAPVASTPSTPPNFELDLGNVTPTTPNAGSFTPTQEERFIAQVMTNRLAEQGTTLRDVCAQRNVDPYIVLFNTFTKGQAKNAQGESVTTTPERADFIAKNPQVVGIQL